MFLFLFLFALFGVRYMKSRRSFCLFFFAFITIEFLDTLRFPF